MYDIELKKTGESPKKNQLLRKVANIASERSEMSQVFLPPKSENIEQGSIEVIYNFKMYFKN